MALFLQINGDRMGLIYSKNYHYFCNICHRLFLTADNGFAYSSIESWFIFNCMTVVGIKRIDTFMDEYLSINYFRTQCHDFQVQLSCSYQSICTQYVDAFYIYM